ncbi:MAG: hypothetical protein C0483_18315 [Pirellula sp.]|nr:hypothetical protein [Pirellula sp.]
MATLKILVKTDLLGRTQLPPFDNERSLHPASWRVTTPGMTAATVPPEAARNVDRQAGIDATRPSLLWIGDGQHPEFALALAALRRHAQVTTIVDVRNIAWDESIDNCAGIVIAQTFAGQFDQRCVVALRRRLPLAPAVVIVGSLAEGERRSGEPLAAALRVPWAQAAAVLDRELSRLCRGACPSWGFGETLTDDERASLRPTASRNTSASPAGRSLPKGTTLVISAADTATAAWLTKLAGTWGATVLPESSSASPSAILWAAPSHSITAQCRQQSLSSRFPGAPIMALANFPRPQILNMGQRLGIVECCALPADGDDLLHKLIPLIELAKHSARPTQ